MPSTLLHSRTTLDELGTSESLPHHPEVEMAPKPSFYLLTWCHLYLLLWPYPPWWCRACSEGPPPRSRTGSEAKILYCWLPYISLYLGSHSPPAQYEASPGTWLLCPALPDSLLSTLSPALRRGHGSICSGWSSSSPKAINLISWQQQWRGCSQRNGLIKKGGLLGSITKTVSLWCVIHLSPSGSSFWRALPLCNANQVQDMPKLKMPQLTEHQVNSPLSKLHSKQSLPGLSNWDPNQQKEIYMYSQPINCPSVLESILHPSPGCVLYPREIHFSDSLALLLPVQFCHGEWQEEGRSQGVLPRQSLFPVASPAAAITQLLHLWWQLPGMVPPWFKLPWIASAPGPHKPPSSLCPLSSWSGSSLLCCC